MVQKIFSQKNWGIKTFWVKKFLGRIKSVKKSFGLKKIDMKKILSKKLSKKNFGKKEILGQNFFRQNNF